MPKHNGRKKRPVRYYSPKRRAIYEQGDCIEHLTLFELHAWTCYVCKKEINKRFRFPHYQGPTVEHIIPLSRGGTHTWDNVAPAHAICNFEKGDSLSVEIQGTMTV